MKLIVKGNELRLFWVEQKRTCGNTFTMSSKITVLEPHEDKLYTFAMLAGRWGCHEKVAMRRAKVLGLPLVRWNQRAICVRLSDVLKAEAEATA